MIFGPAGDLFWDVLLPATLRKRASAPRNRFQFRKSPLNLWSIYHIMRLWDQPGTSCLSWCRITTFTGRLSNLTSSRVFNLYSMASFLWTIWIISAGLIQLCKELQTEEVQFFPRCWYQFPTSTSWKSSTYIQNVLICRRGRPPTVTKTPQTSLLPLPPRMCFGATMEAVPESATHKSAGRFICNDSRSTQCC